MDAGRDRKKASGALYLVHVVVHATFARALPGQVAERLVVRVGHRREARSVILVIQPHLESTRFVSGVQHWQ